MENECKYIDVEDFINLRKRKSRETLTTIFYNVRSSSKNLNEFSNDFLIDDSEYDLLCFAETRLTKDSSPLFKLSAYEMYSNPRYAQSGGVAIYVNRSHSSTVVPDLSLMESEIETVFVDVCMNEKRYMVGCIYRPLRYSIRAFLIRFGSLLALIGENYGSHIVILQGDFNINLLSSDSNDL